MSFLKQMPVATAALIACCLLPSSRHGSVALAQTTGPIIQSVTGVFANGSLLTINGGQLNAERKVGWDPFFVSHPNAWSFEGSDFRADGYTQPGGDPGGVYDPSVRILGNQSVKFRSAVSNPNCTGAGIGSSSLIVPNNLSSDYWVRAYVRWNRITNWPTSYTKMMYAIGAGFYFQPSGAAPGTNPTRMNATYDGASHLIDVPSGELTNGRWFAVELHWKATVPQVFDAYWDGMLVHQGRPNDARTDLGAFLFGIVNACGTASWDIEHWMDGLALATSRIYPSAIVEVGDNSNYSTARKNIQALESISDNQIIFRLNLTNLGAGPYYIWVRNNAQTLTPAFTLGGPAPPTNVRVIR